MVFIEDVWEIPLGDHFSIGKISDTPDLDIVNEGISVVFEKFGERNMFALNLRQGFQTTDKYERFTNFKNTIL